MEPISLNIKRNNPQPRLAASVEYGNLVFLSGQTPKSNTPDIAQQTREVLEKSTNYLQRLAVINFISYPRRYG